MCDIYRVRGGVILLLSAISLIFSFPAWAQASNPNVHITIMLVGDDLSLKPVPRHRLTIQSLDGKTGDWPPLVTSFEGTAEVALAPGSYRIASAEPIELGGKSYAWSREFQVTGDGTPVTLELSNDNATGGAVGQRYLAGEIFDEVSPAVVTVENESGHGTGFLVDQAGLFLTNAHVVAGSRFFAVVFSADQRYEANLVYEDTQADLAVLLVNPAVVQDLEPLRLATDSPDTPATREGEPVFAIGSPLSQEKIISQGIVSRVENAAFITDVGIDHGNSGGPLLNGQREVLGVNTFKEGRFVSGTVRTWKAYNVLQQARSRLSDMSVPSADPLPPYPETRYPSDALERIALSKEFDIDDYLGKSRKFQAFFLTPPARAYWENRTSIEASKGRKRRRNFERAVSEDLHDPVGDYYSWREYGGEYRAVVRLLVVPKTKATFGSSLAAGLTGVSALTRYKFAGDFDRVTLYRNGEEVPYIRMGRSIQEVVEKTNVGRMNDAAYEGWAEYSPEVFRPDDDVEVYIEIVNEAKPDDNIRI